MSTRELLLHTYFSVVLLGYAISVLIQLFISDRGSLPGIIAFLLTFLAGWLAEGKRRPFSVKLGRIWWFVGPLFIVLFLVVVLLSGTRGAPVTDGLPLLAKRPAYKFTRVGDVETWRYLVVSISFCVGWHVLGIAASIELWRHWLSRVRIRQS
jgi:hypothetical protein